MTDVILALLEKEISLSSQLLDIEKNKSLAISTANIKKLKQQITASETIAVRLADLQQKRQKFVKKNLRLNDKTNDMKIPENLEDIVEAIKNTKRNKNLKFLENIKIRYRDTIRRVGEQMQYNQKILDRSQNIIQDLLINIKKRHLHESKDTTYTSGDSDSDAKIPATSNSVLLEAEA